MKEPDPCCAKRNRPGFTLIEVMAAVLLSAIVITIAVGFQINLGSAMESSRERLRTQRQAVALLDRISRDLASTYFIAPSAKVKPGVNPWIFLTGRDFVSEGKSDKIKFITRNYKPQRLDGHASDLAVVAYYLAEEADRPGYKLMRWRETHMPMQYDPSFPAEDNPDADVIGENIASFTVSMIDRNGLEVPAWDSSRNQRNNVLPMAVWIEISMLTSRETDPEFDPGDFEPDGNYEDDEAFEDDDLETDDERGSNRKTYSKLVIIPLRPLDWSFLEAEARTATTEETPDDVADQVTNPGDPPPPGSGGPIDEDDPAFDPRSPSESIHLNYNPAPIQVFGGVRRDVFGSDRRAAS